ADRLADLRDLLRQQRELGIAGKLPPYLLHLPGGQLPAPGLPAPDGPGPQETRPVPGMIRLRAGAVRLSALPVILRHRTPPEIAAGRHTLIAAPTGSGKTLAAFLVCIDRFYRAQELSCAHDLYCGHDLLAVAPPEGATPTGSGPQVVYVSPLKALATDIQQNLEAPLREISAVAGQLGLTAPAISVAVRTGDTAAAERAAMLRRPPDILITTPESLYLLLTAERSRAMLR